MESDLNINEDLVMKLRMEAIKQDKPMKKLLENYINQGLKHDELVDKIKKEEYKPSLFDIAGIISIGEKTNAVELERELYKWMKPYFIDSNFIIALMLKEDALHEKALELAENIRWFNTHYIWVNYMKLLLLLAIK